MIKTKKFSEIREIIELDGSAKNDMYVKVSDLEYKPESKIYDLKSGKTISFSILDTNFLKVMGIVPKMFLKMSEPLRGDTFNHFKLLMLKGEPNKELLFRLNGTDLRVALPPKADILDDIQIINLMETHCPKEFRLLDYRTDQKCSTFQFILSDSITVGVDDVIPGIQIFNSEVGITKMTAESFLFRVVCSNGLITKEQKGSSFTPVSIGKSEWQNKFKEFLNAFTDSVSDTAEKFNSSIHKEFSGDIKEFLRIHFREFKLGPKYLKPVMDAYEHPEEAKYKNTYYGIINAITRGAQEIQDEDARRKLELAAGTLLN